MSAHVQVTDSFCHFSLEAEFVQQGLTPPERFEPVIGRSPVQARLCQPVHSVSGRLDILEESLPALNEEPLLDVPSLLSVPEPRESAEGAGQRLSGWLPSVIFHAILMFLISQLISFDRVLSPIPEGMEVVPIDLDSWAYPEVADSRAALERPLLQDVVQVPSPSGTFVSLPPNPDVVVPPPAASLIAVSNHRAEKETLARKVVQSPEVVADPLSDTRNEGEAGRTLPDAQSRPSGMADTGALEELGRGETLQDMQAALAEDDLGDAARLPKEDRRAHTAQQRGADGLNLFPDRRQLSSLLRQDGTGRGSRQGAPDANLVDGQLSDLTRLNAKGTPYHAFFSAVRRQFNFYYQQAGDNLRARDLDRRVLEKTYVTRFWVKLLPDGRVGGVQIVASSGVPAFDGLVLQALRAASPFPSVPGGLLDGEGSLTLGGECRLGVGMGSPMFLPSQ